MRLVIILLCGFGAWLAFFELPALAAEKGTMTKEEFLEQYLPAAERLKDYYRHVTIHSTKSHLDRPIDEEDPKKGYLIVKKAFRSNGHLLRGEWCDLVDGTPEGPPTIMVANPSGSFWANFRPARKAYVYSDEIYDNNSNSENNNNADSVVGTMRHSNMADIPISYFEVALPDDLSNDSETIIDKIEMDEISGEKIVSVLCHYFADSKENRRKIYARFEFLPDKSWALRFYAMIMPDKSGKPGRETYCKELTYDGADGNIPLIKKINFWMNTPNGKKVRREIEKIDSLKVESTPKSEFKLSILGNYPVYREDEEGKLHKIAILMLPGWTLWQICSIFIGATLLGVGLTLKFRQYRRTAGETD